MIRLMVVDDHETTRAQAVSELAVEGVIQVVAQAETSNEALKVAEKLLPDIVLLDLHLPGLLGIYDLLKRLVALRNVRVIMFAPEGKAAEVQELLEAGATGYVLKSDPPGLIRMAILMVSRGSKGVISPSLPRHITRLSSQERTLLRHLTKRGKLPQIALRIGVSEEALQSSVDYLIEKLELSSSAQLVKWAKKHGF